MVNFVIVEDNKFHMIRTKEIVLEKVLEILDNMSNNKIKV